MAWVRCSVDWVLTLGGLCRCVCTQQQQWIPPPPPTWPQSMSVGGDMPTDHLDDGVSDSVDSAMRSDLRPASTGE